MATGNSGGWKAYHYDPSVAAAVIFAILFLIPTFLHTYQLFRTRTWFLIPLVLGGYFEWIGYIGRAVSANQTPNWTLGPYIVQTILLLVAPALFAASIYMELGRIILLTRGEHHSWIRKTWLTKIFVAGDVFSFLLQAGGGGMMAGKTIAAYNNGSHLVTVGLVVQILFFGFFIITASIFHRNISRNPTSQSIQEHIPWQKHMTALYVCSIFILIRSIFRVIEYTQGNGGYIVQHEWYPYVFDGVLMLGVLVTLNFVHPSEINALLTGGNYSTMGGLRLQKSYASEGDLSSQANYNMA